MDNSSLTRILMVEDDHDIQTVTKFALETVGGFKVEVCGEGQYALGSALEFSPNLILLDVMMPGLDGPGVLKQLRADPQTSQIPVVFMTAKAQPSEIAHFKELGVMDVIPKPFDPMTLSDKIQSIFEEAYAD